LPQSRVLAPNACADGDEGEVVDFGALRCGSRWSPDRTQRVDCTSTSLQALRGRREASYDMYRFWFWQNQSVAAQSHAVLPIMTRSPRPATLRTTAARANRNHRQLRSAINRNETAAARHCGQFRSLLQHNNTPDMRPFAILALFAMIAVGLNPRRIARR